MQLLAPIGLLLTLAGLFGLGWCIWRGFQIRRSALPPQEIHAALHRLIALNLGSVAAAALGLGLLVVGLML
ncbi:hypothetical protein HNP73_001030 [Amaricoccus macauensis]|uniref:Uncharacterized protein n=1 Tax=Amaricoccus macauensis TaxID=57001 RepID=A0A840SE15_9RHOB|nr:hypothetical protein [Amaricoccus macauensis]MBB5221109.1 hypothetical protein [Amaricoccus macauensis]